MSVNSGERCGAWWCCARRGLSVVIILKTNNSRINLEVASSCPSTTIQPHCIYFTGCLFSRLAVEPEGIMLLPNALSTRASFTMSLFKMMNYSVEYLRCDRRVSSRNHSGCNGLRAVMKASG
ncbi:uncharacterized protein ACO6RY_00824 [Pungitius sinensis]